MILLSLLLQLLDPGATGFPASLDEQRAAQSLQSAADSRGLAARFLCGEKEREIRLADTDRSFSRSRTAYRMRFGHEWQSNNGNERVGEPTQPLDDIGRRVDCKLRDSFEAGLSEYQNALSRANSVLDTDTRTHTSY